MSERKLTFGDYPVKFTIIENGDDVAISCKGVTGTMTQVGLFLTCQRNKNSMECYFGSSPMRVEGRKVVIDCLEDTQTQIKFLYEHSKTIQNEYCNRRDGKDCRKERPSN